jgi:hypothetical protein
MKQRWYERIEVACLFLSLPGLVASEIVGDHPEPHNAHPYYMYEGPVAPTGSIVVTGGSL